MTSKTEKPSETAGGEASECSDLLTGEQWNMARLAFEKLAKRQGWNLREHPLHALYLDGETQRFWEVYKAGFTAAS